MTNAQAPVRTHLILRRRTSGVAFLIMDSPGKANLLTDEVLVELESMLDEVEADDSIKALVLLSGKPDTFISGADLHQIMKFADKQEALALSTRGQAVLNRMAGVPKPFVAAINGHCLGGGLEMALSCDKRIATNAKSTIIGLPEVKLGFVPGLGGTQRLPRLIPVKTAVELILSAEPIDPYKAKEIGLVDDVVEADDLLNRAEALASQLIESKQRFIADQNEPDLPPDKLKQFMAMMERSVRIKTRGKYPAHTRVLEVIKHGLTEGFTQGLELESQTFAELATGEVSSNLVFLFFTTERARLLATSSARRAARTATLGIVGGGLMGTTIAYLAVSRGIKVILKTVNPERTQLAAQRVADLTASMSQPGQFVCTNDYSELSSADLIMEAVIEDEQTKLQVLSEIGRVARADAVIATNTSSLSIATLAQAVPDPTRFLGLHFFHPVEKMPLVELGSHASTAKQAAARGAGLILELGKIPVTVKDSPGFLINRLLFSYIGEAALMAVEGVPVNWLEDCTVDFGLPMGPFTLVDEVGLDLADMVAQELQKLYGDRFTGPAMLKKCIQLGLIGKKTGTGVFNWDNNGRKVSLNEQLIATLNLVINDAKADPEKLKELSQRLVLSMVDEAARCLDERIVSRGREIDLCTVLGMGFPAFRGGLLRYADGLGIANVISKLEKIYASGVTKREVSPYLYMLAKEERGFHSRSSAEE